MPAQPKKKPAPAARTRDHVFLVDGSSYIFRAYFAMFKAAQARGRAFTRSDGLPVGAVMTFSNMLWKLVREGLEGVKPTHVGVVFDYAGLELPQRDLPGIQGPPRRAAARAGAAVPAHARGGEGLRLHPDRGGRLRGRRPDRHLYARGARRRRRRHHRRRRQGHDAADPARGHDVRPDAGPRAAHRTQRGGGEVRRRPRQGGGGAVTRRRLAPTTCPACPGSASRRRQR